MCLNAVLFAALFPLLAAESQQAPSLKGTVVDGEGRPLAGAVFVLTPSDLRRSEDPLSAVSNESGRFELNVTGRRGPFRAEAFAPGYAPWRSRDMDPSRPLRVVLERGGESIEGVVRDGTTLEPVEDAYVETRALKGGGARLSTDPRLGIVEVVTDARGEFRLTGLAPGAYPVSASAPGYGRARLDSVPTGERSVEIFLFPGAGIYGRVTRGKDEPVDGALVACEPAQLDFTRPAGESVQRTDSDGRFALLGLEPGRYRLFFRHRDFAPEAMEVEVQKGRDVEVEMTLGPGVVLTGRLQNGNDEPVTGRVSIRSLDGESVSPLLRGRLSAETDGDGIFTLDAVPPGEHTLFAEARGYAPRNVDVSVGGAAREEDVGEIVLDTGLSIQGRVVDGGGAPIAGAPVFGFKTSGGMMSFMDDELNEVYTDEQGRFLLAGLSEGVYRVQARAPGFAMSEPVNTEAGAKLTLTLKPAGSIRGRVLDPDNRPVTTFAAIARAARRRRVGSDSADHDDGLFLIEGLAEDEYALEIRAPELVPEALSGIKVTPGQVTDVGSVSLKRGTRIAGTVMDAAGGPVAGATVDVETADRRFFRFPGSSGATDRRGRFEIRGVPDGMVALVAEHPSYARARLDHVAVDSRGEPLDVEITMRRGGFLEGYVRTRDGTDIAGRTVQAVAQSTERERREASVQTAEDGSFRFEHLPPGPTDVALMWTASPTFYSVQSKPVTIVEGETTYVEFYSRKILVQGQVKKSGLPLSGAEIELWPTKAGPGMSVTMGMDASLRAPAAGPRYLTATTNEDGFYDLLVDVPGEYRVRCTASGVGLPSKRVDVPDLDAFPMDLEYGGATVSGRVVDHETEAPVAGAVVTARPADRTLRDAGAGLQVGADGSFALELEPGEYTLVVRAEGYAPGEKKVALGNAGLSDLVVALSSGLDIRGRVTDSTGRGIANLRIYAVEDTPDPMASPNRVGFAMTVADGSFAVGDLSRGRYNVLSTGGALGGFAFAAGIAAGTDDVELLLRPAGKVELLIVDGEGRAVSRASAAVVAIDGHRVLGAQGLAGEDGHLEMSVPTGNLLIRAVSTDGPEGFSSASVGSGSVVSVRIEAKP